MTDRVELQAVHCKAICFGCPSQSSGIGMSAPLSCPIDTADTHVHVATENIKVIRGHVNCRAKRHRHASKLDSHQDAVCSS